MMKKWIALSVMLLFTLVAVAGPVLATEKNSKGIPQTICPVMGGKIDKNVYADYQGKRVYFCCESCKQEFEKNPDKYLKKLEEEGVTPEKTPAKE
ncbi:MAG: YHS domain-containing protein [Desulfoferrobacter sp.]